MNRQLSGIQKTLLLFGPAFAIVMGWWLFFQSPLQRELNQQSSEANKLQAKTQRLEAQSTQEQISNLNSEKQKLTNQLFEHQKVQSKYVSRQESLSGTSLPAPANAFARLLSHLESHGMVCTSVQPATSQSRSSGDKSEAGTSSATVQKAAKNSKFEIKLFGTFPAMHRALNGLDLSGLAVQIESVSLMEAAILRPDLMVNRLETRPDATPAAEAPIQLQPQAQVQAVQTESPSGSQSNSPSSSSGSRQWTMSVALGESGR